MTVTQRGTEDPVKDASVWAFTRNNIETLMEKLKELREAGTPMNEVDWDELANEYGFFIGTSNGSGKVMHAFSEAGRYLLLATKPGYLPGRSGIAIVEVEAEVSSASEISNLTLTNQPEREYIMPKILVVDDESHIVELTKLYLEREGYEVEGAANGHDALTQWTVFNPDLIILDLMLPDIDGFDICRQVRAKSDVPILMLTARKEDVDKIVGLELGADDYITKPFNPRELMARVKAILRRYRAGQKSGDALEIARLRIEPSRHEVIVDSQPVRLRTKEFALLQTFVENLEMVLSRDKLLDMVWGYEYYGETRTVDVHVNHLREKIAGSGVDIETIRGTGYKMTVAEKP
jgi:DNA-binding response OmpR family regulator